jgi:hypothetical protein
MDHKGQSKMKSALSRFLQSSQLIAGVFFLAAGAAHAQYSTPMRSIDDPGRNPFQLMSQFNTQLPNGNSYTTLTSLPANATQRLVIDYVNIEINNLSGPVQTQGYVTIEVRTTATPTFPIFQMILPVTIMNNTTFGGNAVAVVSQPIRMYLSAGQTLSCTAVNQSGSSNMNIGAFLTGHYVSLP